MVSQIIDLNIPEFMKEKRKIENFLEFYVNQEKEVIVERDKLEKVKMF